PGASPHGPAAEPGRFGSDREARGHARIDNGLRFRRALLHSPDQSGHAELIDSPLRDALAFTADDASTARRTCERRRLLAPPPSPGSARTSTARVPERARRRDTRLRAGAG